MPIVTNMSNQVLDDVYMIETQSAANIQGTATGVIKMVGTFNKGIPGAIYTINDYASAVRQLGASSPNVDGPICLQALIKQIAGGNQVTPVFGTTAISASVTLQDGQATPGNVLVLQLRKFIPKLD